MSNAIFISWERHQRTRNLCKKLNLPLHEVLSFKKGISRYLEIVPKTIKILRKERPSILFVQNPSIILASLSIFLKPFLKYTLIIDAHNEAIEPFIYNNMAIRFVSKCIIKLASYTIVTNQVLANKVNQLNGKAIVLPDFLPSISPRDYVPLNETEPCNITLICTYADDEPYEEIFNAIAALGSRATLYVTGKIPPKINSLQIPTNVKLLGFLSEHDYWERLFSSHIIIDLSTMNNCLVCGAYESLSIQKPLILSNNQASLHLFGDYAEHVENNANSIKKGIENIINNYNNLETTITEFKQKFLSAEKDNIEKLLGIIATNLIKKA